MSNPIVVDPAALRALLDEERSKAASEIQSVEARTQAEIDRLRQEQKAKEDRENQEAEKRYYNSLSPSEQVIHRLEKTEAALRSERQAREEAENRVQEEALMRQALQAAKAEGLPVEKIRRAENLEQVSLAIATLREEAVQDRIKKLEARLEGQSAEVVDAVRATSGARAIAGNAMPAPKPQAKTREQEYAEEAEAIFAGKGTRHTKFTQFLMLKDKAAKEHIYLSYDPRS